MGQIIKPVCVKSAARHSVDLAWRHRRVVVTSYDVVSGFSRINSLQMFEKQSVTLAETLLLLR